MPTKAEIRAQLAQDIDSYLNQGGEIHQIPTGISSQETDSHAKKFTTPLFNTPKTAHTWVPEVVANIESRRRKKLGKPAHKLAPKKPRLKTLYDDFGEPVRKIWVEE